eukprot:4702118-Pyramimonas_sp.AAC.1
MGEQRGMLAPRYVDLKVVRSSNSRDVIMERVYLGDLNQVTLRSQLEPTSGDLAGSSLQRFGLKRWAAGARACLLRPTTRGLIRFQAKMTCTLPTSRRRPSCTLAAVVAPKPPAHTRTC